MNASWLGTATRVIEVDPPDAGLATALAASGTHRYLGLARPERLPELATSTVPAQRFTPWRHAIEAVRNSSDLIVYRGRTSRFVWSFPRYRRAHMLAIELTFAPTAIGGLFAAAAFTVLGLLRPVTLLRLGGARLLLFRVRRPARRPSVRRFASPVLGYVGVLNEVTRRGGSYVALRWFADDDLDAREAGEDLDILVADESLSVLDEVLGEEPGTLPIDAYTVSGLRGSAYRGMAYYPPPRAAAMLARAQSMPSGLRVPSPEDHLHSLAYHALYHKGTASGLRSTLGSVRRVTDPEHDYEVAIGALVERLAVDVDLDLESLDDYLAAQGWQPPKDTLARLATWNDWIRARFFADAEAATDRDLTVFVLRERILEDGNLDRALTDLRSIGFEVLRTTGIPLGRRDAVAEAIRGGNWGPGPYPTSGGRPAAAVVARDPHPVPVPRHLRSKYAQLANLRTLAAKNHVRDHFNANLSPERRCNPLHSSDDGEQAWDYLDVLLPGARSELEADLARARSRSPGTATRASKRRVHRLTEAGGLAGVRRRVRSRALRRVGRILARIEGRLAPNR